MFLINIYYSYWPYHFFHDDKLHMIIVFCLSINLKYLCIQLEKRAQEEKMRRDQLNDQYLNLIDKQRLYFKTVKEFMEVRDLPSGLTQIFIWICTNLLSRKRLWICLQNDADSIFKCIFLTWNLYIYIEISLRFVCESPIENTSPFVEEMIWHQIVDKPLPEPLLTQSSGGWFNIKMSSYQYRKSHCGDKTVVRSSYLHNGISYTGKMSSLYSRIPLSRAPLTRENQLVALAPWTPNFSDAPLATARMTDR